jgi:hypothetical protein
MSNEVCYCLFTCSYGHLRDMRKGGVENEKRRDQYRSPSIVRVVICSIRLRVTQHKADILLRLLQGWEHQMPTRRKVTEWKLLYGIAS